MSMQDRVYAALIFVILGLCCIGAYVAISGFTNANPNGISLALNGGTATPTVGVTVEIPTETAGPPTNTPPPATKTPVGFQPTDPPAATRGPTLDFIPTIATAEVTATPEVTETPTAMSGGNCGSEFCPRLGPPEANAPGGNPCPSNLIWGFIVDRSGQGMEGIKIKFRDDQGNAGEKDSKGPPDLAGVYDFPVGSGVWTVQVYGRGDEVRSIPFQVAAGQAWSGSGNCPTRVDFVQQ